MVRLMRGLSIRLCLEFDKLVKQIAKGQNIIRQSGYPPFYLNALVQLEAFLNKIHDDKEAKKKLNALNAKAITAMKQKLKKLNTSLKPELDKLKVVLIEYWLSVC